MTLAAICFDLDGTLIETEEVWADVRKAYVRENGGTWHDGAQRAMMGMNAREWSDYLHGLGVARDVATITRDIEAGVLARYRAHLPIIAGALEAVRRVQPVAPLALVTGSPRVLIEAFLDAGGLRDAFSVTVSADETPRGKPAPDAYLRACALLGVAPRACVAIEDSGSGMRSAVAAGLALIAIPSAAYPPLATDVQLAAVTLASIAELDATVLRRALSSAVDH